MKLFTINEVRELLIANFHVKESNVVLEGDKRTPQLFFDTLALESFYVRSFGSDIYVPSPAEINDIQWGYSYIGNDKLENPKWPKNCYVVAAQTDSAFVYDFELMCVSYANFEDDKWCLRPIFNDLKELIVCLAVLGAVADAAKIEFCDENGVSNSCVDEASKKLTDLGFDKIKIRLILQVLSWA